MNRFALILFVIVIQTIGPTPAAATPKESFMVSPAKLEVSAKPGESQVKVIKVANQGNMPIRISAKLADYFVRPDNTFVFFSPGHQSYSSARWVKLDKDRFDLQPGEAANVRVKVDVPKTAEVGGHYTSIFFQNRQKKAGNGISIVARIGALLLSSVGSEKDIVRRAEVKDFTADNSWADQEIMTRVILRNTGNVHLSLKGTVTFTDFFGRKVGSADLSQMTVLPKTERQMNAGWSRPAFGRITAQANIRYGRDLSTYDKKLTSKTVTFWIVPWRQTLAALGLLLAVAWARAAFKAKRGYAPRHATA